MAWWKLEIDNDGAILACEPVESKGRSGAHITYVEADTKAGACSNAKAWLERRNRLARERYERLALARRAAHECIKHGTPKPCRECYESKEAYYERKLMGITLKPRHETPEDAQEAARASTRRYQRYQVDIRTVLDQFTALGPVLFVAWLRREVEQRGKEPLQIVTTGKAA